MKKVDKSSSAGTKDEQRTEADVSSVSQPIAKPNVVCQGGFTDAEIEEMAIKEIVYNDVKRAWWVEGAKYINNKIYKNGKTKS